MNTSAELFRELSYIADDEVSMAKLLAYVKELVSLKKNRGEAVADEVLQTKSEMLEGLDQACKELRLQQAGKMHFKPAEALLDEL